MASPPKTLKLKALAKNPKVALTIDEEAFPHKVLMIRGSARLESVEGIVPEYEASAARYFDPADSPNVDEATPDESFFHGPHHDHAGMGRAAGLQDAISERLIGLRSHMKTLKRGSRNHNHRSALGDLATGSGSV